jgi:dCMP deaminase
MKKSIYRKILKYVHFMNITKEISKLSYDNKHKVGSILVKNDFSNINSIGYNGNYAGGSNERDSMESGMSGFLHAEENVIIKANVSNPEEYTLFVTMTPCEMCAKRIINKGIKNVIILDVYDGMFAKNTFQIFDSVGVHAQYLKDLIISLLEKSDIGLNTDFTNINFRFVQDMKEYFNIDIKYNFIVPITIDKNNEDKKILTEYLEIIYEYLLNNL